MIIVSYICEHSYLECPNFDDYSISAIANLANACNVHAEGNGDSGTSGHYLPISCENLLLEVQTTSNPISVECPNGAIIKSTKTGILNMPNLPVNSRICHLFPNINGALLSIGKFCDNGMTALFDDSSITISNKITGEPVLTGRRDSRGMYMLPLITPTIASYSANSSIYCQRTDAQLIAFISSSWGNPADSTLLRATEAGYLKSIPKFTPEKIRRYKPNSIESAKGHLDRVRQGIRSTKQSNHTDIENDETIMESDSIPKANQIFVQIACSSTLHGDSTGDYPITSRKGNTKILIGYSEKGNFICPIPIKGNTAENFIEGYSMLLKFFNDRNIHDDILYLDNQTSIDLETYFEKVAKIKFKLAPPHNHRTLKAERNIRTFKNHLTATMAGIDPAFPRDLWDELLDQEMLTLNTLRSSNLSDDTDVSAWDNAHPIGPAGAKVLIYESPDTRSSFADHGVEGFYLGPSWKHYRCFRVYVPATRGFRITDTLSWHHRDPLCLISNMSATDILTKSISQLSSSIAKCNISTLNSTDTESIRSVVKELNSVILDLPLLQVEDEDKPPPGFQKIQNSTTVPTQRVPAEKSVSTPGPDCTAVTVPSQRVENENSELAGNDLTGKIKSSKNLRTNKHHVFTDPNPTSHIAKSIIDIKGSISSASKPLRFRVRWEGFSYRDDTWEPLSNVKDCQAF